MCGRHHQRHSLAAALITGFVEQQRQRSLPSAEQPFMASNPMSPNSQIQGVTAQAPAYVDRAYEQPVNPNPPSYEEVEGETTAQRYANISHEKPRYEIKGARAATAPLPPHEREYEGYSPNSGIADNEVLSRHVSSSSSDTHGHGLGGSPSSPHVESFPEGMPQFPPHIQNPVYPTETLPRLLSAIALFYDTKIHMNQHKPLKAHHLEKKKARKMEKATRKYEDKVARSKDPKYAEKMEKRTAKIEKWTNLVVRRYDELQAKRDIRSAYIENRFGPGYSHGRCGGDRGRGRRAPLGAIGQAPQMMSSTSHGYVR